MLAMLFFFSFGSYSLGAYSSVLWWGLGKMVVWSSLCKVLGVIRSPKCTHNYVQSVRNGLVVQQRQMSGDHGHRVFPLAPSRFQWHKFKDLWHYYMMVGLIPVGIIVFCANVFVGPAQLAEIPDDYVPKYWEYNRHPITRFLARYVLRNPQQEYEKFLHYTYEEDEKAKIRKLERQIREKMAERHDYQAYYYRPAMAAKYVRVSKEVADKLEALRGQ